MSMLSSQIDELRELADDIESRYGYPTAVKALRDAADTIWQLRDDLQRANAATLGPCSDSCNCTNGERTDLDAENAKLRELALALADCRNTTCDDCVRWDYPDGGCSLDGVMRELGIEVDE